MFMIFSIAWGFSTGIVGPFFSVYMINTLQIPFSIITLFGVAAGLSSILGFKVWGAMIDKIGAKPLSILCGIGGSFVPFLWIFASPENYLVIWASNILSGLFFAGIGLASTGLMMNLASGKTSSVYFAVFAAVTSLLGAVAPIAGGAIGDFFRSKVLYDGIIRLSDIRLLFLTSTTLRLLSLTLIRFIVTPETVSVSQLFASISQYQKFLPLYQLQNAASTGMSYIENATTNMSRGVIAVEQQIDTILARGGDLGKVLIFKARSFDRKIDEGIGRHEAFLERLIDKILQIFSRRK
ncbi:MAG: MFS transporter [Bacillota bacterium]|nr:MFS transporter [Bacillota bacterium]